MTKATCIRCRKVFELPEDQTIGYCPVCGQKMKKFVPQVQVELGGLLGRIPLLLKQDEWEKAQQCCEVLLKNNPVESLGYLYHYMARNHLRDLRRLGYDAGDDLSASTDIQRALEFADNDLKAKLQAQIVFQERLSLLDELRRGNAEDDQMTIRLRKDLDELWEEADDSENVVKLFQQRLDREFVDYAGLLQRQLQALATSNTAESEQQFETLVDKLMAIGKRGDCLVAAKFAEEDLPELRGRRNTIRFNNLLTLVSRDDEAWDDFYPRLRKLSVEMNNLAKLDCKEAKEFLQKDFQEICFRRACAEELQKHYDHAIALFQYCKDSESASHLDNCIRKQAQARNKKNICVAAGCLIVLVLALFGVVKWWNAHAWAMLEARWYPALAAEDFHELREVLVEAIRRGGKDAEVVRKYYTELKEHYSKRLDPILRQVRQDMEKQNFPSAMEGLRAADRLLNACEGICGLPRPTDEAIAAWLREMRAELSSVLEHHVVSTTNSTSDKEDASPGAVVTLTANLPEGASANDYEYAWSSTPAVAFTVVDERTRSFTMPLSDVTVGCAMTLKTYAVTTEGCTADKADAARGETVTLTAMLPEGGALASDCDFAWSSTPVVQFTVDEDCASFEMPAEAVSVTCAVMENDYLHISELSARQLEDDGKLQINYSIQSNLVDDEGIPLPIEVEFAGYDVEHSDEIELVSLSGDGVGKAVAAGGPYTVVWDMGKDQPTLKTSAFEIRVEAREGSGIVPLPDGPVVYVPLVDASARSAKTGQALSYYGSPRTATFDGRSCVYFDGTSAIYNSTCQFTPAMNECSISIWFHDGGFTDGSPAICELGIWNGWKAPFFDLFADRSMAVSQGIVLVPYCTRSNGDCNFETSLGVWHHAVITGNATKLQLYLDGELVKTCRTTSLMMTPIAESFVIGSNRNTTKPHGRDGYWKGYLSAFRVYPRVLTADEVAALATEVTAPPEFVANAVSEAIGISPPKYSVVATGVTADKSKASTGETVTVTANLPEGTKAINYDFVWNSVPEAEFTGDGQTATFTMPASDVTVGYTMRLKTSAITVIGGTADKPTAVPGETVTVTANLPEGVKAIDYDFVWSSVPEVEFTVGGATATFTMPATAVKVTYMATRKSTENTYRYLVVDLSGGADATSYPVRYTNTAPDLSEDTCRTTELWLRRIPRGLFPMGSPENEGRRNFNITERQHQVILTQDYYIGVFECTQKQYELVMGTKPSYFNNADCYATRPVEQVSYNDLRGTSAEGGAGWPSYGHAVDADSFFGKLQAKTGLAFDLPTEAQWEYACRASTFTALNSGKDLTAPNECPNMAEVGRYWYNGGSGASQTCTTANGTAKVGAYLPNAWGLYDMHGNVWEWCLDWYQSSLWLGTAAVSNPAGSSSGSIRVLRGGSWGYDAQGCRSAYRGNNSPSYRDNYIGFRVAFQP